VLARVSAGADIFNDGHKQGDYPRAFVVFDEPQTQPIGYPFACGEGGMSCGHATLSESIADSTQAIRPSSRLARSGLTDR
jgi:hypothetical protein